MAKRLLLLLLARKRSRHQAYALSWHFSSLLDWQEARREKKARFGQQCLWV